MITPLATTEAFSAHIRSLYTRSCAVDRATARQARVKDYVPVGEGSKARMLHHLRVKMEPDEAQPLDDLVLCP